MRKYALVFVVSFFLVSLVHDMIGCFTTKEAVLPMTSVKTVADSLGGASNGIKTSATTIETAAKAAQPKAPVEVKTILGEVPTLRGIADAIVGLSNTLNKAIADELAADKVTIDGLREQIVELKRQNEANMTNTFRIGVIASLVFIGVGAYLALKGAVSWVIVGVGTGMLALLLALMRYARLVSQIGLGLIILVIVATLVYAIYRVVKAHGSITEAIDAAKADMATAATGAAALGILRTSLTVTQRAEGTQKVNDALRGATPAVTK